jgi:tetratricopeptide (TPR) repeat protein
MMPSTRRLFPICFLKPQTMTKKLPVLISLTLACFAMIVLGADEKSQNPCEKARELNKESEVIRNSDRKAALQKAQEALTISENASCPEMIALSNKNIGIIYFFTGAYPEAEKHYNKALSMYETLQNKTGVSALFHNIAYLKQSQSKFDDAIELYQKSADIDASLGDLYGVAVTLNNISMIHQYRGNYSEALHLLNQVQEVYEQVGDLEALTHCLNNMAAIYLSQGMLQNAMRLYQQVYQNSIEEGLRQLESSALYNMGIIEFDHGNYYEAMDLYTNSLIIKTDIEDKAGISLCLSNIGSTFQKLGQTDRAIEYYLKALKNDQELGNELGIATHLAQIGTNLLIKKEPGSAIDYFEQSNEIAGALKARHLLMDNYKHIFSANISLNNYDLAYQYFNKYIALKDSLTLSPDEIARINLKRKSFLDRNYMKRINYNNHFILLIFLFSLILNGVLIVLLFRRGF